MSLDLGVVAQTTAEGSETMGWLIIPMLLRFLAIFVLFGIGLWRLVSPSNWARPCPSCGREGGHSSSCPSRPPPRPKGPGVGSRVIGSPGLFGVLEGLFGGED